MSNKTTGRVTFTLDPQHPPALDTQAKARLEALPDEAIDYSNIPPQIGMQWTRPGALVPTANKQ